MTQSPSLGFLITTRVLAAILAVQCAWLLLAELSSPSNDRRLPTDPKSAATVFRHRDAAIWAAGIGAIRGDLWAQSAYTYADLLWGNPSNQPELTKSLNQVRDRLYLALRYAPHEAGAWLLTAGLASHYRWSNPAAVGNLKMSYYTGPSELRLVPLRSLVAMQLATLDDELQIFVKRDLRILITQDRPAILEDYRSATPAGKQLIESALSEIDPTFKDSLRIGPH